MGAVSLLLAGTLLAFSMIGCGGGSGDVDSGASTAKPPPSASVPDPQPGSKAAAPGVPVSREGDNSIQTYGLEAGSDERAHVTRVVRAYLDARAARDWAVACSYLAAKQRRMLERLAAGPLRLEDPSCAGAEATLVPADATGALVAEADVDVLSLRMGRELAFLIYDRPQEGVYATAVTREGGRWKIVSVAPTPVG